MTSYPHTHFELRLELMREYFIAVNHQNPVVEDHYLSLILSGLTPNKALAITRLLTGMTERLKHSFMIHAPSTINLPELVNQAQTQPRWSIKKTFNLILRSLLPALLAGELTFITSLCAFMLSGFNLHLVGIGSIFSLAGIISGLNGLFVGALSVGYQLFTHFKHRDAFEKQIETIRELQMEKFDVHNDIHLVLYKALAQTETSNQPAILTA